MNITISVLPPEILQNFNKFLLQHSGFDKAETFENILLYIEKKLMKKTKYNQRWREKCEKQLKECKVLYEKIKEKQKTETRNKTQEPFYSPEITGNCYGAIYPRLKDRSSRFAYKYRIEGQVSEV